MRRVSPRIVVKSQRCSDWSQSYTPLLGETWEAQYNELHEMIRSDHCIVRQVDESDVKKQPDLKLGDWVAIDCLGNKEIFADSESAYQYAVENYHSDWGLHGEYAKRQEAVDELLCLTRVAWLKDLANASESEYKAGILTTHTFSKWREDYYGPVLWQVLAHIANHLKN